MALMESSSPSVVLDILGSDKGKSLYHFHPSGLSQRHCSEDLYGIRQREAKGDAEIM